MRMEEGDRASTVLVGVVEHGRQPPARNFYRARLRGDIWSQAHALVTVWRFEEKPSNLASAGASQGTLQLVNHRVRPKH